MPDLTQLLANPGVFPQQTGQPTGVVNIPAVGLSGDTRQGSGLASGLNTLGQGIENVGRGLLTQGAIQARYAAIQERQRLALEKLDTATAYNAAVQDLDIFTAESARDPDTRQHPARVRDYAAQILHQRSQSLSPTARAQFTAEFTNYTASVNRHALKYQMDTDLARVGPALDNAAALYQSQVLNAQSPADARQAEVQFQRTLDEFAGAGLLYPEMAQKRFGDAVRETHRKLQEVGIYADPVGMLAQAQAAAAGRPLRDDLPPVRGEDAAFVISKAQEQVQKQVITAERTEQQQRRALQDVQGQQASRYREALYKPGITIPEILATIEPINTDRRQRRLSEEDHANLLTTAHTLMEKLRADAYSDKDVPAIRQEASIRVERADTPAQLETARDFVLAHAQNLSASTFQAFLSRIDVRREQSAYTNRDAYKEGRGLILDNAFPGGIAQASLDKLDDRIKAKLAIALDIYAETMQDIYTKEGRAAGDAKAREVARNLRDSFFQQDLAKPELVPTLPENIQEAPTMNEALRRLEALQLPLTQQRLYYRLLKPLYGPNGERKNAVTPRAAAPGGSTTSGAPRRQGNPFNPVTGR